MAHGVVGATIAVVPRWSPDAETRLKTAALELFQEYGYESVTIAQITERAELTRRSFFRYFSDKREVLFVGSERLPIAIEGRMEELGPDIGARDAMLQTLTEAGALLLQDRGAQKIRQIIIDSSEELKERERTKLAAIAAAISRGLSRRGIAEAEAASLGAVAAAMFQSAYHRSVMGGETGFDVQLGDSRAAVSRFLAG